MSEDQFKFAIGDVVRISHLEIIDGGTFTITSRDVNFITGENCYSGPMGGGYEACRVLESWLTLQPDAPALVS